MITRLTKDNFWDALKESYPGAVDHFCKWIDEYKKEANWNELFSSGGIIQPPKFHDLPFEMQNGIIARFELELFNNINGKGKEEYQKLESLYRSQIRKLFEDLQTEIEKRNREQTATRN